MSEWWTYRLSDFLLFSPETYYRLIELYNAAIWPGQILAIAGGVATLVLLRRRGALPGRLLAAILALAWLFVAWAYLYARYATINWAAPYFAMGFAVQAVLLILSGTVFGRMSFRSTSSRAWLVGFGMGVFAVFAQPVIGPLVGRGWTADGSIRAFSGSYGCLHTRGRTRGRPPKMGTARSSRPLVRNHRGNSVGDGSTGCLAHAAPCSGCDRRAHVGAGSSAH